MNKDQLKELHSLLTLRHAHMCQAIDQDAKEKREVASRMDALQQRISTTCMNRDDVKRVMNDIAAEIKLWEAK